MQKRPIHKQHIESATSFISTSIQPILLPTSVSSISEVCTNTNHRSEIHDYSITMFLPSIRPILPLNTAGSPRSLLYDRPLFQSRSTDSPNRSQGLGHRPRTIALSYLCLSLIFARRSVLSGCFPGQRRLFQARGRREEVVQAGQRRGPRVLRAQEGCSDLLSRKGVTITDVDARLL